MTALTTPRRLTLAALLLLASLPLAGCGHTMAGRPVSLSVRSQSVLPMGTSAAELVELATPRPAAERTVR